MIHPGYDESQPRSTYTDSRSARTPTHASVNVTQYEEDQAETVISATTTVSQPDALCCVSLRAREKNVCMPTAVVSVVDCYGKEHFARAILDSASQANLMTERMAQLLRLRRSKVNLLVNGVGGHPKLATESVTTQIRSRRKQFTTNIDFIILEKITPKLPAQTFSIENWKIPDDVLLADPEFNRSSEVDLLISNEHFFTFFTSSARIELSKSLPFLVDSVFGWLVSGALNVEPAVSNAISCNITTVSLNSLHENLEKFWKIEELPIRSDRSPHEKKCEEFYIKTVSRMPDGRYIVRLPRHTNFETMIGETEAIARRRFELLERRLEKSPELKGEYHRFMSEYLALGHMRPVQNKDSAPIACYLPHHPVVKDSSTTTKVRVVFDASVKTNSGFSLNDALLVGPVVQDDLLSIILRFRTYPVALVADIEKMYRQVMMHPEDTPTQRILWRFSPDQPVQIYELLTVTYGMAPSSFLATRTLQQLSSDEGNAYPRGGPALRKGFYVDDFIGGASTIQEAIHMRDELIELLAKGGFPLRKWSSNKLQVLEDLATDQTAVRDSHRFDADETVKTLGVCWEPEKDTLRFDTEMQLGTGKPTKRSILSTISRLFDPLGLVSPVVIRGKMIIQQLWSLPCGWDDKIPETVEKNWMKYVQQLQELFQFRIDRYALLPDASIQLHIFSDASEKAYGCCIYARSINATGNIRVELLASKSRVAPLKRVTLPRLELCAADLAAKLYSCVRQALNIDVFGTYFWSDSMVTLQWLRAPPNTWKTFVANRVSEIQTTTQGAQWNHVAGKENPADLISRGMDVREFITSILWKHGSDWLSVPEDRWPKSQIPDYPEHGSERRRHHMVAVVRSHPAHHPFFELCSSYSRLVHIIAYCLKFVHNVRSKARTQPGPIVSLPPSHILTVKQTAAANALLVRLAQADAFKEEIRDLKSGKPLSKHSNIRSLCPFLDSEGTIRVGGRLRLSEQPYISKHPALLPNFHPYALMIAKAYHLMLVHGGGRATLATIRQTYWPVNGRRLVRSVLRNCLRCVRASPVPAAQQMGQLPAHRVTASRPFTITGVDFAGPVYLKPPYKRAAAIKAYICIFICFCTKAVHIELVGDLSTQMFLCALRRFIARRGRPSDIYSDNGKNFEGAKNELDEIRRMLWDKRSVIEQTCTRESITWHMNPPKAPHFGGLWEAAVKVAKKQMYRQLGNTRLNFEDMTTLLSQIEASMNSRPLVPMTEDPSDLSCLTPAHFLIGASLHVLPEPDIRHIALRRLDHYQHLQQLNQQFWHHWRTEYLQELQRTTKMCNPNTDFLPGKMVVIVDEHQIPVKWPLARIVALHPGEDSLSRVVSLRTSRGIVRRPITKICLLPVENAEQSTEEGQSTHNQSIEEEETARTMEEPTSEDNFIVARGMM
ncbi:uncharacterized protein LOC131679509 [Topomyia yanbarensis]|uniref:uncharacterized protein LOC131679509 n=1 Tax=Topomyia yanbarensis TaxID=2498891 RepID=UPI00273AD7EE|nr:uncharacterized protein LOC131679509 [Topomyia yanbarensis]